MQVTLLASLALAVLVHSDVALGGDYARPLDKLYRNATSHHNVALGSRSVWGDTADGLDLVARQRTCQAGTSMVRCQQFVVAK